MYSLLHVTSNISVICSAFPNRKQRHSDFNQLSLWIQIEIRESASKANKFYFFILNEVIGCMKYFIYVTVKEVYDI